MRHALVALCLVSAACSSPPANHPTGDAGTTGETGSKTDSLIGTWDLMTTPVGGSVVNSTVVVGQDSLSITSPGFTLTASRSGNVLSFVDNDAVPPAVFGGTETAGTFDPGLVPFTLGGSWTLQGGDKGAAATIGCTLQVSPTKIDATCNSLGPTTQYFSFTSSRGPAAASSFGDFGGTWNNVWVWGKGTKSYPCALDFTGSDINSCAGGAMDGQVTGSPLAGITFTYDGANTISGSAKGWAEFAATRH